MYLLKQHANRYVDFLYKIMNPCTANRWFVCSSLDAPINQNQSYASSSAVIVNFGIRDVCHAWVGTDVYACALQRPTAQTHDVDGDDEGDADNDEDKESVSARVCMGVSVCVWFCMCVFTYRQASSILN